MVQAWYMDNKETDQRAPHQRDPPRPVTIAQLNKIGVEHIQCDASKDAWSQLRPIRDAKGYNYADELTCSPEKLPDYEAKLKIFFKEHMHTDEEIRYNVKGGGYFDVRDGEDDWIRIKFEPGDLLIVPAGIYHRFTLDENDFCNVIRLFKGEPVWTPHNRPEAEEHAIRQEYSKQYNIRLKA